MKRAYALLAALCGAFALSQPAFAEEGEHATATLSQLDVALYPGQVFWITVCFFLFFLIVRSWVLPPVQQTQGNRRRVLDADLSAATKAGEQAQKMIADYEKALADAREKSQGMINEIILNAKKTASAQSESQQKELEARIRAAEDKIRSAKSSALREVQGVVQDVAKMVVQKVKSSA